jgi:hypothetical protein
VSTWTARRLAWSVGIASIVLLVVALVLIGRSRETYSGKDILLRMARLLAEGTGTSTAVVSLRVGREVRPAAMWPTNGAAPGSRPLTGDEPPEFDEATASVPVSIKGRSLVCSP